jgi:hypothetical protein
MISNVYFFLRREFGRRGLVTFIRQFIYVTKQDFVFLNERRNRFARHAAFWAVWCVAYLLLFHYPIYAFKGWGFNPTEAPLAFKTIREFGLPLFIVKTFIFSALLAVVPPSTIYLCYNLLDLTQLFLY